MRWRLGKFYILDTIAAPATMDQIRAAQRDVAILRVEHRADLRAYEVIGICDEFDEIVCTSPAPEYECVLRIETDGTWARRFKRREVAR